MTWLCWDPNYTDSNMKLLTWSLHGCGLLLTDSNYVHRNKIKQLLWSDWSSQISPYTKHNSKPIFWLLMTAKYLNTTNISNSLVKTINKIDLIMHYFINIKNNNFIYLCSGFQSNKIKTSPVEMTLPPPQRMWHMTQAQKINIIPTCIPHIYRARTSIISLKQQTKLIQFRQFTIYMYISATNIDKTWRHTVRPEQIKYFSIFLRV